MLYVDSSAVAGAYFPDEEHHPVLHRLVFGGANDVVTSTITRVELSSAIRGASDARRLPDPAVLWNALDADLGPAGAISALVLRAEPILALAASIVRKHRVRTLDAIHLAVALEDGTRAAAPDALLFTTVDQRQAEAARSLGLEVHDLASTTDPPSRA